jgi:hypothetical protein
MFQISPLWLYGSIFIGYSDIIPLLTVQDCDVCSAIYLYALLSLLASKDRQMQSEITLRGHVDQDAC